MLPSKAITQSTTFDVFVMTRALEYYDRKNNPKKYRTMKSDLSQDQLQGILNKTKGKT